MTGRADEPATTIRRRRVVFISPVAAAVMRMWRMVVFLLNRAWKGSRTPREPPRLASETRQDHV